MVKTVFQPFTDRLSRDIRNDLSKALASVLEEGSLRPAEKVGQRYLEKNLDPIYCDYINNRLQCYSQALLAMSGGSSDPLFRALILWDQKLFFEVHEILEHAWLQAKGEDRLFLQAMIRAAGAYIKREAGYAAAAQKIAEKAIPVLERNEDKLLQYTDPRRLIGALRNLDAAPPKLVGGEKSYG